MKKYLLVLLFLVQNVTAAPYITKVIELHYQQAQTIIQLVQPLLQNDEQITGSGQTLIVKVSPETLTQLRVLLQKLDQPPVTFEVTVFQGDPDWLTSQNNHDIVISTSSAQNMKRRQSVMVSNGESAFISTGTDQPMVSNVGIGLWTGINYERRQVQNGLLVEPTLQGQKVKLNVKRVREQNNQVNNQVIDEQHVVTTVLIPLNQWVALGSAEGNAPAPQGDLVFRAGNQYLQNSTLYIKVTVVGKALTGHDK